MEKCTLIGMVGDRGMAPRESEHNGKMFRRCGIWVDDPFGEPVVDENGKQIVVGNKVQRKRKNYQLVFEDERLEKAFKVVRPGRKLCVQGRLDDQPRVAPWDGKSTRKEIFTDPVSGNKYVAWSNPKIHVESVRFIDSPVKTTAERFMASLAQAGKINDDQAKNFVETIVQQLSNHNSKENTPTEGPVPHSDNAPF